MKSVQTFTDGIEKRVICTFLCHSTLKNICIQYYFECASKNHDRMHWKQYHEDLSIRAVFMCRVTTSHTFTADDGEVD